MEEARSALQALSYRELQARAKAYGVRAIGKSGDLLESVAKAMISGSLNRGDGPATPNGLSGSSYDADENTTPHASAGPLLSTPPASGRPLTPSATIGIDNDPLTVAATATKRAADAYAAARSELQGTPSLADLAAKASAAALAASLANLRLQSEMKPSVSRVAPASLLRARAVAQDAQASQLMVAAPHPTAFPSGSASLGAVSGGSFPATSSQHLTPKLTGPALGGSAQVPEPLLEDLEAEVEAGAGAPGSDLMSQLDEEEAQLEEAVRRLAFGVGASPGPSTTSAASARTATVTLGDIAAAAALHQQHSPMTPTLAPARLLASVAGTSSGASRGVSAMEMGDVLAAEGHGEAGGAHGQAEAGRLQAGRVVGTPAARAMGCGSSSCSPMDPAAAHQHAMPVASASAPSGSSAGAGAAAAGAGLAACEPFAAGGGAATSPAVPAGRLITDRTPARMQRMMGVAMVPPVSMAPMPTPQPAARPVGGVSNGGLLSGFGLGGGAGGMGLPRTPGTGLRTPARRVAVISDEAQAQALDEWVRQNLLLAPAPGVVPGVAVASGADNGDAVPWGELVGLDDVKQQLQALCVAPVETAVAAACSGPGAASTSNGAATAPSDAPRRASARVAATGRTPGRATSSGRPANSASGSPTTSISAAAAAGASEAGDASRGARPSRNLAVLLCGPQGAGKGLLARALAAQTGAAYLRLPGELLAAGAGAGAAAMPGVKPLPHGPGHMDAVVRAVFRVASSCVSSSGNVDAAGSGNSSSGGCSPAVMVHLDNVDQLAGLDAAGRDSSEGRRIRTELQVALDELLLQNQLQSAAAGSSNGAGPSGCGAAAHTFRLLVLATTSRPEALDEGLAARLGASACLLAGAPESDAREMFLVARLAAEGAALGVEQIDRLVMQTEGFTCGSLAAACHAATAAASARRGGTSTSRAGGRKSAAAAGPTASDSSAAGSRQSRATPRKLASAKGAREGSAAVVGAAAHSPVEQSDLEAALQGLARHRVAGEQMERMQVCWERMQAQRQSRA
ncbi:hypothetical protein HXX76_014881 [Chlamydomonas incerta]|uniref:ATPase AAA-type core domain-containing protein n=1 Tax=Chlamydomonas incerta TaxID=51695 RepID=A0A835VQE2_CHLIN|nr:hypothetical protein HXX76_014881 [Chlamydomonas incerta]|eukprot:KAG2423940.1 hypothetical protein HXX76_014881 [Chlamydomonas incerta]